MVRHRTLAPLNVYMNGRGKPAGPSIFNMTVHG